MASFRKKYRCWQCCRGKEHSTPLSPHTHISRLVRLAKFMKIILPLFQLNHFTTRINHALPFASPSLPVQHCKLNLHSLLPYSSLLPSFRCLLCLFPVYSLVSCFFPSRLSKYFVYFHFLRFTFHFSVSVSVCICFAFALFACASKHATRAVSVSYFSHSFAACIFHLFLIYLLASKRSCSLLVTGYLQLLQTPPPPFSLLS